MLEVYHEIRGNVAFLTYEVPRKREAVRRRKGQKIRYPSYGMEVRETEMETTVTRGCRSLQRYTEECVCGIPSSYCRTEVTDVLTLLTWFAVARFA